MKTIRKEIIIKLTIKQLYFLNRAIKNYQKKCRKSFLEKESYVGKYLWDILNKNLKPEDFQELKKDWDKSIRNWNIIHYPKKIEKTEKVQKNQQNLSKNGVWHNF